MATTSPDNIWTPDSGDDYALTVDLAAMADTIQNALNNRIGAVDTGNVFVSLNGGWTNVTGTNGANYRVKNGYVTLNGRVATGNGSTTHAFTLPENARPAENRVHSVSVGGTTGVQAVVIQTDGKVIFPDMTIPTPDYRLASIGSWPVAT